MGRYYGIAIALQVMVDLFLLLGIAGLWDRPLKGIRATAAALTGGICSGLTVWMRYTFFQSYFWHLVSILLVCGLAFGREKENIRPALAFFLLRVAMDGIVSAPEKMGTVLWTVVLWGVLLCALPKNIGRRFVSVRLDLDGKTAHLRGLVDTGNSLRDPITGSRVLVVGADIADSLAGLNCQQLMHPVENLESRPGLRLVPYKTVSSSGLMLAMQLKHTRIGRWKGSSVVAFAPRILDEDGKYQALVGGML